MCIKKIVNKNKHMVDERSTNKLDQLSKNDFITKKNNNILKQFPSWHISSSINSKRNERTIGTHTQCYEIEFFQVTVMLWGVFSNL